MDAKELSAARPCEPGDKTCVDPYPCLVHDQPDKGKK